MAARIFFCYAHEDEALLNKLKSHLSPLQRQGIIDIWHDRDISAGSAWEQEIARNLNAANIILLLISPDFMNSDYCYGIEMKRAIERHERGEACVIPIILEHVHWQIDPLDKLQVLPTDARPIVSASWHSQNEAFYNVVEGIRRVIKNLTPVTSDLPTPISAMPDITPTPTHNMSTTISTPVSENFTLVRILEASSKPDFFLCFSPDGRVLAATYQHGSVGLWNVLTGELLRTVEGTVLHIFSPDGRLLASGPQGGKVMLWDALTGETLSTLEGSVKDGPSAFPVFSSDGKVLASYCVDGKTRLWDLQTGQLLHTLEESGAFSTFSPDGQLLATTSKDGKIKLWNTRTGKLLRILGDLAEEFILPAFSPNGNLLTAASEDGKIRLWSPDTGTLLLTIEESYGGHVIPCFSPDGKLLVGGYGDGKIRMWNPQSGQLLHTLDVGTKGDVYPAFSPDGQLLAGGCGDGKIRLWARSESSSVQLD